MKDIEKNNKVGREIMDLVSENKRIRDFLYENSMASCIFNGVEPDIAIKISTRILTIFGIDMSSEEHRYHSFKIKDDGFYYSKKLKENGIDYEKDND